MIAENEAACYHRSACNIPTHGPTYMQQVNHHAEVAFDVSTIN